jgi:hypothetical protein
MSFAFNAHTLASATSCCEEMGNSCAGSKSPLECCDKNLLTAESVTALGKVAPLVAPPATYVSTTLSSECPELHFAFQYAGLPLTTASPPLVLRI